MQLDQSVTPWRSGPVGEDFDVVIVGFGPVGAVLAILLAQRGHSVAVIEKHERHYPKPRAVVFDDEVARLLASAGIADQFPRFTHTTPNYVWQNAHGEELLRFDWAPRGASGWHESNGLTQPNLEEVLYERALSFPTVTLHRGTTAIAINPTDDGVEVIAHSVEDVRMSVRGRYVVGADGANSFVRQRMRTSLEDLGFFYDWLICDLLPDEEREWEPSNRQVCDPDRPYTSVDGGPGRRRFEFMRMPDDDIDDFDSDENAWRLLGEHGITPERFELERRALYTFQARWVSNWRDRRLMVAGDAAHLMPPFAGQGMCSGIRDAGNLAWKLDLVLRGIADDRLLDTYSSERSEHVKHAIHKSVELGRVICETDPEKVAARDAHFKSAGAKPEVALPPLPPETLGPGALQSDARGLPKPPAGQVAHQGFVTDVGGRKALLDDVVGFGFHLLVSAQAGVPEFSAQDQRMLDTLDVKVVMVSEPTAEFTGAPSAHVVQDTEHVILPWLAECGHVAQLVRPDFAVFGGVAQLSELPALLGEFSGRLTLLPQD